MLRLPIALVSLCLCFSSLSVGRAEEVATTRPAFSDYDRREAYFHHSLVDAYETVGSRNAAWDVGAREVLVLAAQHWATLEFNPDLDWQIMLLGDDAVDAGCNDPAVLYSDLRAQMSLELTLGDRPKLLDRLEKSLVKCRYAPFIKVFALARLMDLSEKDAPKSRQLRQEIYDTLPALLAEKEFPQNETAQLCSDLTTFGVALDGDRKPMMEKLDATMTKALPRDSAIPDLFLGLALWRHSWDAPGVGEPDRFGSDREQRHKFGRAALDGALRKDPRLAAAAAAMVGTMVDEGTLGDELERYFQRAIKADPDCSLAYRYKIGALNTGEPGADANIMEFGRVCVATKRWRSRIPFMMLRAHHTIAGEDGLAEFYKANPQAWRDVENLYESYFIYNPKAVSDRIEYAKRAVITGHIQIVRNEIGHLKALAAADPLLKRIIAYQAEGLDAMSRKANAARHKP